MMNSFVGQQYRPIREQRPGTMLLERENFRFLEFSRPAQPRRIQTRFCSCYTLFVYFLAQGAALKSLRMGFTVFIFSIFVSAQEAGRLPSIPEIFAAGGITGRAPETV